jgi:pimeloyl-ACP methyl ester carboxylesterase
MVTEAQIRRIALALPGAYEHATHGGRPSWRTQKRMFAWLREEPEALVVWVDSLDEKGALLEHEPRVFFTTPHYDGHPMVLVRPDAIDLRRAERLITESWKLRAPAAAKKGVRHKAPTRRFVKPGAQPEEPAPTTFVLIPGAGGAAWYWHRVMPLLEKAGHEALAVDLPADDARAGLRAYADIVLAAIGKRRDVTLVAQSMGAFTAALVCARAPEKIRQLVFVNAMIPVPGETARAWWDATGSEKARQAAARRGRYPAEFDLETYFLHDVPKSLARELAKHERDESETAFREPARFTEWPDVPIHVVVGKDDRLFPREFQKRVARDRLGTGIDEIPGGHLIALSRPRELATLMVGYAQNASRLHDRRPSRGGSRRRRNGA